MKAFAIQIKDKNIRFNLTGMAGNYDTDPAQWLRTEESKRYIECLSVLKKCRTADLVTVRRGGRPHEQGTWANDYRIAVEFARWLDTVFSIRVNDLIWRILTKQAVAAEPVAGVWPVIQNGRVGYPRREILLAAGYSPGSGTVSHMKRRYPESHFTIAGIACVSAGYARFRLKQGEYRQSNLELRDQAAGKRLQSLIQ
jgi:hypothetical protein